MAKKTENTKETLPCGVSDEQLAIWKEESEVHLVSVKTESGTVSGYFKKPNLQVIGAASKYAATDPVRSGLILFESCWLAGDPEMREVDEIKMSAIGKLGELFKVYEAEVKKL
jgi:hypothetical protein